MLIFFNLILTQIFCLPVAYASNDYTFSLLFACHLVCCRVGEKLHWDFRELIISYWGT